MPKEKISLLDRAIRDLKIVKQVLLLVNPKEVHKNGGRIVFL